MVDFEAEAGVRIPERELAKAERQVEDRIGSVSVGVDEQRRGSGLASSRGAAVGGLAAGDAIRDQTEILEDILDTLEKSAVSGGGGGGGGLFGGLSGFGLGAATFGSGGLLGGLLGRAGGAGSRVAGALGGASRMGQFSRLRGAGAWLGRSPYTMLAQSEGVFSGDDFNFDEQGNPQGDPGGPQDLLEGDFKLKEDFWPGKPDIFNDIANGRFTLKEDFWPNEPQLFKDITSGEFTLKEDFWPSKPGWLDTAMSILDSSGPTNEAAVEDYTTDPPRQSSDPSLDTGRVEIGGEMVRIPEPSTPDAPAQPENWQSMDWQERDAWLADRGITWESMQNNPGNQSDSSGNRARDRRDTQANVTVNNDVTLDVSNLDRETDRMKEDVKRELNRELGDDFSTVR